MNSSFNSNVLFVAGGTGGHIFPALSVYSLLGNSKKNIFFVTDQRGIKFKEISEIKPLLIRVLGFEGKAIIKKLLSIFLIIVESFKAVIFIRKNNIKIIIGFGSYVQVPFILAGLILHKNKISFA